jgi:SAM-dependent methyltransferase
MATISVALAPDSSAAALAAYEPLAPYYDALTSDYAYSTWLTRIDELARELGAPGSRLLDAACGTGSSFAPMLGLGWDVEACDISPRMVEVARQRAPEIAERIHVADVRALPWLERFDLITFLDDAANYLLDDEALEACLRSFWRALRPGGLVVLDCNTRATCRFLKDRDQVTDAGTAVFCWRATGLDDMSRPFPLVLDVFARSGADTWRRESSVHWQRHHSRAVLRRASARVGLEVARVLGQHRGARLSSELDERVHSKALYVLRRPLEGDGG